MMADQEGNLAKRQRQGPPPKAHSEICNILHQKIPLREWEVMSPQQRALFLQARDFKIHHMLSAYQNQQQKDQMAAMLAQITEAADAVKESETRKELASIAEPFRPIQSSTYPSSYSQRPKPKPDYRKGPVVYQHGGIEFPGPVVGNSKLERYRHLMGGNSNPQRPQPRTKELRPSMTSTVAGPTISNLNPSTKRNRSPAESFNQYMNQETHSYLNPPPPFSTNHHPQLRPRLTATKKTMKIPIFTFGKLDEPMDVDSD